MKAVLKLGITIGFILFCTGWVYTIIIGFRLGFIWGLISIPAGMFFCIAEGLFWGEWMPSIEVISGTGLLGLCGYFYRKKFREGI